ncbi:MAG TPA: hypothetical protein GXX36_03275 [Clostridiaceae bacterium]|nr:hypothetical protein [Clostridiaceae bacterium]
MEYKGTYLSVHCKNKCFEKMIDEIISQNIVEGIEPKVRSDGHIGYSGFTALRYSKALKRHVSKSTGHYLSKRWKYCPMCGEKL